MIPDPQANRQHPLVSIVTPCLNSALFLEETIQSVLSQDYPNVEYLVMDGGSTDGSLAILDRYRDRLAYISAPDRGTADAINRGLRAARGEIVAWISADDTYLPGAVRTAVEALTRNQDAGVVYGEAYWTDETGQPLGPYPTIAPYSPEMFSRECGICQPASFIRRTALESVGFLDETLQSAFDYDLWIRLSASQRFLAIPQQLATSRMHQKNKSLGQKETMFRECVQLLQRSYDYVPVNWVYGYACFLRDRTDQFYQPVRRSAGAYLRTLIFGSQLNSRHPVRYWGEWLSMLTPKKVLKFWREQRLGPREG